MSTKILVVEDELVFALDLTLRLGELGYVVLGTASDAAQMWAALNRALPDVVLMDINLAGEVDGITLATEIYRRLRLPSVFLTAYGDDAMISRARAAGAYGYLIKPCTPRDLHAALQVALARRTADAESEAKEQRLRLALDAASMQAWDWGAEPVAGAQAAALPDCMQQLGIQDRVMLEQLYAEAVRTATSVRRLVRPGMGERAAVYEIHARAVSKPVWPIPGLIGVLRDITTEYDNEMRLRRSAVVYATLAEGVAMMDGNFRVLSINPAFSHLTGFSESEIVGEALPALVGLEPSASVPAIDPSEHPALIFRGEAYWRRKDGSRFPVWQELSAVQDPETPTRMLYVLAFSDVTAMRNVEAQRDRLAHQDELSGLANRLVLVRRLAHAIEQAKREARHIGVAFIDLDGFKLINDSLGHAAGDRVIKVCAERISSRLREADTAARVGSDEFVVLLDRVTHAEDVGLIAEKLLQVIAEPIDVGDHEIQITASVGLAVYPHDGGSGAELLRAADTAMFAAKSAGRNRFSFYTADLAERAEERLQIEQGMIRALAQGGFEVFYQPLFRVGDGSLWGVEALLRWRHPQQGLISPERFIGVAEQSDLIDELGAWVLREACMQAQRWLLAGAPKDLRLAVNVSMHQFRRGRLPASLDAALRDSGFPAAQLDLELTETALQAVEHNARALSELKARGVTLTVDDFGTGYSALASLKALPVDRIKIDRSFVRDIPRDPSDLAIVQAIVAMARKLNLEVIAEGVETLEQSQIMTDMACDIAQGFLYAHPLPADELSLRYLPGLH